MFRYWFLFSLLLNAMSSVAQNVIFEAKNGNVNFSSKAPQELISATSKHLVGVLDVNKKQFAFKIDISSFNGFNNALQKSHFNENYMESSLYPTAIFKGKIIESIDLSQKGSVMVRAKGKLSIHGVEQDRIIDVQVNVLYAHKIEVKSTFKVMLADHNIKIPRVVTDKLSPEILVEVEAQMQPK